MATAKRLFASEMDTMSAYVNGNVIRQDKSVVGRCHIGLYYSDMQTVGDWASIAKTEHSRDGSIPFLEFSPEPKVDEGMSMNLQNVQVQKAKGGREPVCLNSVCELPGFPGLLSV